MMYRKVRGQVFVNAMTQGHHVGLSNTIGVFIRRLMSTISQYFLPMWLKMSARQHLSRKYILYIFFKSSKTHVTTAAIKL